MIVDVGAFRLTQRRAAACHRELRRAEWFARLRAVQAAEQADAIAAADGGALQFNVERKPFSHRALLECLWDIQDAERARATLLKGIGPLESKRSPLLRRTGGLLLGRVERLPGGLQARVESDLETLEQLAGDGDFETATRVAEDFARSHITRRPKAAEIWSWYERDAASVYALLEKARTSAAKRPGLRQTFAQLAALRAGDYVRLLSRGVVVTVSAAARAAGDAIERRSGSGRSQRRPSPPSRGSGTSPSTGHRRAEPDRGSSSSGLRRGGRPAGTARVVPRAVQPPRTRPRVETGEAHHGFMPERLARMVEEQPLNAAWLDVNLRGYQDFGARYALLQRRILLGDEMGLGKTIVALAVMAHLLAEEQASHFLVVVPNSVLFNWRHEIEQRLPIPARTLHGNSLWREGREWRNDGGVGITTYGTLHNVRLPVDELPLLVVDEAHYVKNPNAKRTVNVGKLLERTERVMFMTGTPLENRVSEFRALAGTLNPDVIGRVPDLDGFPSDQFRAAAAPVYLRRNQEDVLPELPETIEVPEWVDPTTDDESRFVATLERGGHFVHLRYCAFPTQHFGGTSAKLERLAELVDDAMDEGRKVVIFSEFHDTLEAVRARLTVPTFGPIIGAVSGEQRFSIIRDFTNQEGGAVLISQIQAGGIGLNIQAASVVILCEPALKPSVEEQAIARAARMGQTRNVRVHRLLSEEGIDRRILDMLARKRQIFDDYARRSAIAEVSEAAVERQLVSELTNYAAEEAQKRGIAVSS